METLRQIILMTVAISMVLCGAWMRNNPRHRWFALAPLTVILNIGTYHLVRILDVEIPIEILNAWSASIHLHILILIMATFLIYWRVEHA